MKNGINPLRLFSPYRPRLGFAMGNHRIASSISQFFSNILALVRQLPTLRRSTLTRTFGFPSSSYSSLLSPGGRGGNKLHPNTI